MKITYMIGSGHLSCHITRRFQSVIESHLGSSANINRNIASVAHQKEKKEKKEGKKEFKEVLKSRDLDNVFEIQFGCKRRIF